MLRGALQGHEFLRGDKVKHNTLTPLVNGFYLRIYAPGRAWGTERTGFTILASAEILEKFAYI